MAQGAVAPGLTNGIKKLTAEELHEILECEKIVRFRDAVLAGIHPRIQVPAHLKLRQTASPAQQTGLQATAHGELSSTLSTSIEDGDINNSRANPQWSSPGRSAGGKTTKSEINPILLEKSDDLIKAEIQLRRQRLERALREQIEQRRVSLKASLQTSESLPDFDISEVLSKALSIAHSSADVESEQIVGTRTSAASDSFDENTFYSSQHDTPGLSSPSQGGEAGEAEVQQLTTGQAPETVATNNRDESHDLVMTGVSVHNKPGQSVPAILHQSSLQHLTSKISHPSSIPGLGSAKLDITRHDQSDSLYEKDAATSSSSSSHMALNANLMASSDRLVAIPSNASQDLTDLARTQTGEQLKRKFGELAESPSSIESSEPAIIQARNELSPFAPQPARISPLATARGPPILDQTMIIDEAPPAQVAALRKASVVSTPESSPKGTKTDKKKKKKKSTRKSTGKDSTNVDTPNSPYIKPEPLSPSPFTATPLPRPNKRQRQAFRHGQELNYDEPRYDSSREEQPQRAAPPKYREPAVRPVYDRFEDVSMYEPRDADPAGFRRIREEPQYRRVVSHESYRAPKSPDMYSMPHARQEIRPIRATSHIVTEAVEPPRYYKDSNLPSGAIHIDLDRERSRSPVLRGRRSPFSMAPPPRMAPMRIVVDEYGRQYYAPLPTASVSRQSIAPHSRVVGEDIVYERPPRHSVAPVSQPDGDDILYERPPPRQLGAPASQPAGEDVTYERPVSRQPVVPSSRTVGDDVAYERPPPRLLNRPIADVYEEDGVLYRRSSPAYAPPRRVVTQPDLDTDYRSYRQREYSARPVAMAPPEDYMRPRDAPLRQMSHFEEAPREFAPRVGSVRPEAVRYEASRIEELPREYIPRTGSVRPGTIRYEMPREYVPSLQSVHPESLGREYTAGARSEQRIREFSVRPEPRREIAMEHGVREFSVRPGEGQPLRKEYLPALDGSYSSARPMGRRIVDEVEYRERTREVPQDMYDDGARREVVYR